MIVMKFGGTSVQDENAIKRVGEIVKNRLSDRPIVVVSAMGGVTRLLLNLAKEAENQNEPRVLSCIDEIKKRHITVIQNLGLEYALAPCEELLDKLSSFVMGICQIGELSSRSQATILSFGELLSSVIVNDYFNKIGIKSKWQDARKMIITDDNYLSARPLMEETKSNIVRLMNNDLFGNDLVITQGFIASTQYGFTSVLGFEGSDYTAALIGMAIKAERIEIWTDVDGIRTADPRIVKNTCKLCKLTYDEAGEMAHLGARVLHPMTMEPARIANIPIHVLNTMNPQEDGSVVSDNALGDNKIKSISSNKEIDFLVIELKGAGYIKDLVTSVFSIFSKYKLCFYLCNVDTNKICISLESNQKFSSEVYNEIEAISRLSIYKDKAQLSVIGNNISMQSSLLSVLNSVVPKIYMMFVGLNLNSYTFIVDKENLDLTISNLHTKLFE